MLKSRDLSVSYKYVYVTRILSFQYLVVYCVVPESIHTPTTEGIGNSRGFKSLGNSRGVGG